MNVKFFFAFETWRFFTKMVQNHLFMTKNELSVSNLQSAWSENFFDVYYMSVEQKLTILKICLTIVTVMILGNLEAAPEEALQLRGLIKGSNWSLGHYLFGRHEFWKFWPPIAQIPGGGSHEPPPSWSPPEKRPALIGLRTYCSDIPTVILGKYPSFCLICWTCWDMSLVSLSILRRDLESRAFSNLFRHVQFWTCTGVKSVVELQIFK